MGGKQERSFDLVERAEIDGLCIQCAQALEG